MPKKYKIKELQQKLEKQLKKEYELVLYPILTSQKKSHILSDPYKENLENKEEEKYSLMSLSTAYLLNEQALAYSYYLNIELEKNYALLAIPKIIYFQNKKYFIGEMGYKNTVASIVCSDFIPKEFIYGIGEKVFTTSKEDDEVIFDENKKHICFLGKQQQEQAIKNILEKKHISVDMLEAIQHDDFSFQGNDKEKEIVLETIKQKGIYEQTNQMIKCTEEDIFQKLKHDLKESDYIALHNICVDHCDYALKNKNYCLNHKYNFYFYDKVYQTAYNQIIRQGLIVPYENVMYTVTSLGKVGNLRKRELFSYNYWDSFTCCNVIISIPKEFHIDGKNYFVGILSNWGLSETETLLTSVLLKEKVPSEFIYGYYIKRPKKEDICIFHVNENHIHNKSLEEQEAFYKNLLTQCNVDKNMLEIIETEQESSSDILRNTIEEKKRVFKIEDNKKIKQKNFSHLD